MIIVYFSVVALEISLGLKTGVSFWTPRRLSLALSRSRTGGFGKTGQDLANAEMTQ